MLLCGLYQSVGFTVARLAVGGPRLYSFRVTEKLTTLLQNLYARKVGKAGRR